MAWVKEPPHIPENPSGIFYWYYDIEEDDMWPTEVYKGCWKLHKFNGLWWDEPISLPPKPKETKKCKKKEKTNEKPN